MRTLRFDRSRDGVVRATVVARYRIEPEEVVDVVTSAVAAGSPPRTRTEVSDLVRRSRWAYGEKGTDVDGSDEDAAVALAIVRRLFPEIAEELTP